MTVKATLERAADGHYYLKNEGGIICHFNGAIRRPSRRKQLTEMSDALGIKRQECEITDAAPRGIPRSRSHAQMRAAGKVDVQFWATPEQRSKLARAAEVAGVSRNAFIVSWIEKL